MVRGNRSELLQFRTQDRRNSSAAYPQCYPLNAVTEFERKAA